jgi:hypothetical protein
MVFSATMVTMGEVQANIRGRPSQPPVINTTNVLTAYVGKLYSVNYTATDPDTNQSSLVWSWSTNSTWLSFTSSQELKGKPIRTGVCWVNISVTDGSSYDFAVFYIVVNRSSSSNQPPVITTTNVLTAFVGKYYSVNYTATDTDTNQSSLIWSWKTNSTWLNFTSSQELKGTPTKIGVCWVNISVTDGTSYDYTVFYIVVNTSSSPSNQPPVINTTNVLKAFVGKYYSVNYTATDSDTNQSSLIWRWSTNSTWLTFTSSQELKGTPTKTGVCWVNISVTDGTSHDYAVFYIVVNKTSSPPPSKAPKIITKNVLTAYVGKYYSVNYSATDPDTNQSSLVWSWKTNSTWLNFTPSQELKGTPTKTGVCWVNISVTDGTNYDYAVFYIVVKSTSSSPSRQAPMITTKNVLSAYVGKYYSVNYSATDPDTNQSSLIWSWKTNSTWLTFTSSQELKGTPTKTGVCWVNVTVSDGNNSDHAVFYIVVKQGSNKTPSSKAPKIITKNILYATVGLNYSVQYLASDPDTNASNLKWAFRTNSTWLKFSSSQLLYGTPSKPGVCWVNLSVSDGTNTDYTVFYIVVKKRNTSNALSIISKDIFPDDTKVPTDLEKVTIVFSEPVNPTSVESALSISPEVSHVISWDSEETEMTIVFFEELSSNTEYIISIDTSAKDIHGNTLETDYHLEFTTELIPSDIDDIDGDEQGTGDTKDIYGNNFMQMIAALVIIILIFIILAYLFVIKKRKKIDQNIHDGRVPSDFQNVASVITPYEQSNSNNETDVIFENVVLDAFGPDKPDNLAPEKEVMINELNLKLNNGEISQNTYVEAMNILSGKIA